MSKNILVYGGSGGLGQIVVKQFLKASWNVFSADFRENNEAQHSFVIKTGGKDDITNILKNLKEKNIELDSVVCVAGGFMMETVKDDDIFAHMDRMYSFNISSSLAASHIASHCLKKGGLLVLTGAFGALQPTPVFLAYGISKAGVHHLVKSLAQPNSGMPENSSVVAMLPVVLDTPQNRKDMPDANFDNWTPLETVSELLVNWSEGKDRPSSGSLIQIKTENKKTHFIPIN